MSSLVLISQKQESNSPLTDLTFITLPHPRYGPKEFVLSNQQIFEFQSVQPRKYGSWLIDQRICQNSSYYLLSKFDMRYILLPFLENAQQSFRPLNQIITTVEGIAERIPFENSLEWKLEEICDVNDRMVSEGMPIFYRVNHEKVMSWLRDRVTRIMTVLSQQRIRHQGIESNELFDSSHQSRQPPPITATATGWSSLLVFLMSRQDTMMTISRQLF
jgi:hypothetical protein